MKQILLGSPANAVSISLPDFICLCSGWEKLADFIYIKHLFGSSDREEARSHPPSQRLTCASSAGIGELVKSRQSVALALYPRSTAPIQPSYGLS